MNDVLLANSQEKLLLTEYLKLDVQIINTCFRRFGHIHSGIGIK